MASIRPRKTSLGTVYHVRVRIKGAPAQSSVHRTLTHAKQWAQATEAAIRERRFFPQCEAARHTVAEAIDRYLHDLPLRSLRQERNRRRQLLWWRYELGRLRFSGRGFRVDSACSRPTQGRPLSASRAVQSERIVSVRSDSEHDS